MSTENILMLVGAALVALTILDSFTKNGFLNSKLKVIAGILGLTLILYGGYSYEAINPGQLERAEVGNELKVDYPVTKVLVTSPVQGDAVACRILTKGVYPEGHNKDIWVLLKPNEDRYYPQSDHTNTSYKREGEWQVITRFGGDENEKYELVVYETDEAASKFFSDTIEKWVAALDYPGLLVEDIPSSAKEIDRITVTLKNNCRGVH